MKKVICFLVIGIFFLFGAGSAWAQLNMCTAKGKKLYGKVKVVNSFADIKVKVVNSLADIRVKKVTSFPNSCGEWQFVDSFPDFTIQYVDSFPDITVQFVNAFPGT